MSQLENSQVEENVNLNEVASIVGWASLPTK